MPKWAQSTQDAKNTVPVFLVFLKRAEDLVSALAGHSTLGHDLLNARIGGAAAALAIGARGCGLDGRSGAASLAGAPDAIFFAHKH